MRSFEIFVAPESLAERPSPPLVAPRRDERLPRASLGAPRRPAREVLDIFIEGVNVTERVVDTQAPCVLRDLGLALVDLSRRPRGKAIVRFYDDPWELCVERFGHTASLSVYRTAPEPLVAVYDRSVAFDDVLASALEAIESVLARGNVADTVRPELEAAAQALRQAPDLSGVDAEAPPASPVVLEIDRDAPIAFAAEFLMREGDQQAIDPGVERADLHALLFRGRMRAEIRGSAVELGEGHPFLAAELLLEIARDALDAWERGLPYHVRTESGGLSIGVRLDRQGAASGRLDLTLRGRSAYHTFPALGVADLIEACLAYGRALVRAILRRDRTQCTNLRLSAFRRSLRETTDALREVCRQDTKINPTPEPYRAFAQSARKEAPPSTLPGRRLRYAPRWRALVPGIDLRATFLCGDRLIVGGANETFCLDRSTGEVIWRRDTARATSVVTPGGIARLSPDGTLAVHDFGDGGINLMTQLAPRVGGATAGAVVSLPGLPRLLIVTEGEHHLVAIDLLSGEPRWRYSWGKKRGKAAGVPRMKRAGKLLYFTSGDSALTAIDVLTGAVVWRVRDRLRFRTAPPLFQDLLFAAAGGASCLAQVHAIDPFSGHVRWTRSLPDPAAACTLEGAPMAAAGAAIVAVRRRDGLRLVAFDRETGALRWESKGPVAPTGTSWLAVDDLLIGNTPTGEVVALEGATGDLRYRHVLGRILEADVPRRLEPVLRSGALFVPHTDVHVLRPHDGELLARIGPTGAIADLLRVDERCDVYIAEESGHLVSFSALPQLSLVK